MISVLPRSRHLPPPTFKTGRARGPTVPRVAVRLAYDGTQFDSFSRQPRRRTVEAEVLRALEESGAIEGPSQARYEVASRTDAGVSAAGNVFAVDTTWTPRRVLGLSTRLPEGLRFTGAATVAPSFRPRHARSRTYRYVLPASWNRSRAVATLGLFEGEHDFSNFRRRDGDKNPCVEVTRIRHRQSWPGPLLEIVAPRFLWQQVRRIVAAAQGVVDGRWTHDDVANALHEPGRRADFGVAPPEPLILQDVAFDDVTFDVAAGAVRGLVVDAEAARRRWVLWETARGKGPTVRR